MLKPVARWRGFKTRDDPPHVVPNILNFMVLLYCGNKSDFR